MSDIKFIKMLILLLAIINLSFYRIINYIHTNINL